MCLNVKSEERQKLFLFLYPEKEGSKEEGKKEGRREKGRNQTRKEGKKK